MTIYLDAVFLENFVMNFAVILSEAVLLNSVFNIWKKVLAALIGTFYYIATLFCSSLSFFQLMIGGIIVVIAFAPNGLKMFCKIFILYYFINFLFAGVAFALMSFFNQGRFSIFNGVVIGNFNLIKLFLSVLIGVILLIYFFRKKKEHVFKDVVISINGVEKVIRLLLDTGNLLREPYTARPVMIVEKSALKGMFDNDVLDELREIFDGKRNIPSGMFLIPYKSIGNRCGFLLGVRPDFVRLKNGRKIYENLVIGICDENLSDTKSYSGIFGLETLDEGVCEI